MSSMIDRAKEKLRLIDYLYEVLGEPTKIGVGLRWNSCPNCGKSKGASRKLRLSRQGDLFRCAKCGETGDVIKAIQICEGFSQVTDAARWVLYSNQCGTKVSKIEVSSIPEENPVMNECLLKIYDAAKSSARSQPVVDYLLKTRALTPKVMMRAQDEGILRFLPADPKESIQFLIDVCGESELRESGLWREGAKVPGIAFRPLMFFFPDKKGAEFRVIKKSSVGGDVKAIRYGVANQPWLWMGSSDDIWSITEGAIDLLSIPCLNPSYNGNIMGVPGCNNWVPEWFDLLAGKRVFICFDNDLDDPLNPGQTWAKMIFDELLKIDARPMIRLPEGGKDINEMLIEERKFKR